MFLEKEYAFERPCVEFWTGYDMEKGIKVTVHDPTTIEVFKPHPHPYGTISWT